MNDLSVLFKLNDISSDVQRHLSLVYTSLCATFLCTVIGMGVYMVLHVGTLFCVFGCIAIMFVIHWEKDKENFPRRLGLLAVFGFLQGFTLGPLIELSLIIDPMIVLTALLCTMTIFGSFSLAAVLATRRSYLFLGGMLSSALQILILLSVVGMFVPAMRLVWLQLYGGLIVFSAYVVYDTQLIIERVSDGGVKDFAGDALKLYLDAVNIFVRIINILIRLKRRGGSSTSGGGGGSGTVPLLPIHRGEL